MPRYTVASYAYGPVFKKLLFDRVFRLLPNAVVCGETEHTVTLCVEPRQLEAFSLALAMLLTEDLRPAETARLVGLLPLDVRQKQSVLSAALAAGKNEARTSEAAKALRLHLEEQRFIVAEGFLRFRLQQVTEDWALAADRAGMELLEKSERRGLMRLLAEVMEDEARCAETGRVRLILHGEGVCTLSDENGCIIESTGAAEPSIMGLLMGMAPKSLDVYDLTEKGSRELTDSIREVFGPRARIFVKRS